MTTVRRHGRAVLSIAPAALATALLTASCGSGTGEGTDRAEGATGPTVEVTDVARTECGRTWEEAYGEGGSDEDSSEVAEGGADDVTVDAVTVSRVPARTAAPPPDPEIVQSYERRVLTDRSVDGVLTLELTLHGQEDAPHPQRLEQVEVEIRDAQAERWVGHAVVDGVVGASVPADPPVDVGAEPATTTIEIAPWACPEDLGDATQAAWDRLPDGEYYLLLRGSLEPEPGQGSGARGIWSTDHILLTVAGGELSVSDTNYPHDNLAGAPTTG